MIPIPGLNWIKIIAGLAVLGMVAGAVYYVFDLQNKIETLTANNVKLESAVETQQDVIDKQIKDVEEIQRNYKEQREFVSKITENITNLENKFEKVNAQGVKRDINKLATAKTKRVEKIINNASGDALRCVELSTGAPLTEEEKNATIKSETNSICPDLANPNYIP